MTTQILISAFDNTAAARRCADRLVKDGFPSDNVHLHDDAAPVAREIAAAADRGVLTSLGHFVVSLFGKDHPGRQARRYSEAVRRGGSVVCVEARNDEEAEHAATVLHGMGAINVEERAQNWRADGWTDEDEPDDSASVRQLVDRPGVHVIERRSSA